MPVHGLELEDVVKEMRRNVDCSSELETFRTNLISVVHGTFQSRRGTVLIKCSVAAAVVAI